MIHQLTIIGLGLLGGSVALAAKQKQLCNKIVAYDIDVTTLAKAKQQNIIDDYYTDIHAAVNNADIILLATAITVSIDAVDSFKDSIKANAIITDVGSVKGLMIEKISAILGDKQSRYVPAHPIAGREKSGLDAALVDLFVDKKLIITPTKTMDKNVFNTVKQFWQQLDANVITMDADEHDKAFAMVSHLPQLLAYALMNTVADNPEYTEQIYSGFNEITRIAASDPKMWTDIFLTNKENVLAALNQLQKNIDAITTAINKDNSDSLLKQFIQSKNYRLQLTQNNKN